jgi:hypothetical protein
METPMLAIIMVTTSIAELCRTAEMIPRGIPTSTLKVIAAMLSSMVVGRRSTIKSVTGLPYFNDVPRSPRKTSPT